MNLGIGLDASLRLSFNDQAQLSREIARLGFTDLWTPDHTGEDPFQTCLWRWMASTEGVPGGLTTGIGVVSLLQRSPLNLAQAATTMHRLTDGRFVLGIGTGGAYLPEFRAAYGVRETSMLRIVRDYLTTIRSLQDGEEVVIESDAFAFHRGRLNIDSPAAAPVYLGALGPEMLRLAGELADGVVLNWCTAEQVAWSRERIAEGATRSGRDPADVKVTGFIRVAVDDDIVAARHRYVRALLGYAVGPGPDAKGRPQGYRAHFERMGFAEPLAVIDAMRAANAPEDEVIDAVPDELALAVGYYGTAAGARAALTQVAQGFDTAIARVVAEPGVTATRAVVEATAPR